jgi:hypothetical protein
MHNMIGYRKIALHSGASGTPAQHRKSAIVYAAFTSSGAWHVPMFATGDK